MVRRRPSNVATLKPLCNVIGSLKNNLRGGIVKKLRSNGSRRPRNSKKLFFINLSFAKKLFYRLDCAWREIGAKPFRNRLQPQTLLRGNG
jgi:hypothetical protein